MGCSSLTYRWYVLRVCRWAFLRKGRENDHPLDGRDPGAAVPDATPCRHSALPRTYARGMSKVLRKAPPPTRRQEFSASTKRALVDVAADLFTAQGYAGTSLDEIVSGADVTKGALYHHFSGK